MLYKSPSSIKYDLILINLEWRALNHDDMVDGLRLFSIQVMLEIFFSFSFF